MSVAPAELRPIDEHANFVTHALGFLLSVAAATVLMLVVVPGGSRLGIAACGVYSATLVGLYAASMLSHLFHVPARRRFFRTLDQACIYLLIAGSFTPIAAVLLRTGWWPALPAAMWGLALLGAARVLRVRELSPVAMLSYGALGWLPAISLHEICRAAPFEVVAWFIGGGALYTLGAVFLRYDRQVRYFHALWHAFVIAGSAAHYIAILILVA